MLRPGVWHGYEDCQRFEVYNNCCFSSELLRRELSWTREDPLLGFLLWAGPYSSPGRGVLTTRLEQSAVSDCLTHLSALAALRHRPLAGSVPPPTASASPPGPPISTIRPSQPPDRRVACPGRHGKSC
ncbi:MAG: hypothetical protein ACLQB1_21880 [Streptosporangiaceae bacterium]